MEILVSGQLTIRKNTIHLYSDQRFSFTTNGVVVNYSPGDFLKSVTRKTFDNMKLPKRVKCGVDKYGKLVVVPL